MLKKLYVMTRAQTNKREIDKSLKLIPCPLCGNEDLKQVAKHQKFGLPCHVSICPHDGFVFLSPRWSKERYNHFYSHEYDSYYRPQVFQVESQKQKYGSIRLVGKRLDKYINDREHVLDVGAGMGWSLEWLKLNYSNFQSFAAIESSAHCTANLVNNLGVDVIAKNVESDWHNSNSGRFDLIIMRHVLEHFLNPLDVLNKVRSSLGERGIVYVAVPDMMNPIGSLNHYWFRVAHVSYFSESTLIKAASMADLVPMVTKSEGELWAIFRKSQDDAVSLNPPNVYNIQLGTIKKQRVKSIFIDILQKIKMFALSILPKRAKRWLRGY